jgi:hypothetical protein
VVSWCRGVARTATPRPLAGPRLGWVRAIGARGGGGSGQSERAVHNGRQMRGRFFNTHPPCFCLGFRVYGRAVWAPPAPGAAVTRRAWPRSSGRRWTARHHRQRSRHRGCACACGCGGAASIFHASCGGGGGGGGSAGGLVSEQGLLLACRALPALLPHPDGRPQRAPSPPSPTASVRATQLSLLPRTGNAWVRELPCRGGGVPTARTAGPPRGTAPQPHDTSCAPHRSRHSAQPSATLSIWSTSTSPPPSTWPSSACSSSSSAASAPAPCCGVKGGLASAGAGGWVGSFRGWVAGLHLQVLPALAARRVRQHWMPAA